MYSTFISVALFAAVAILGALADFTVDTPQITECEPVKLTWDSTGAKSYNVIIVPSDDPCNGVLADLGDHTVNHITWNATLAAGTSVMVSVLDAEDNEGWSGNVLVAKGNSTSCLAGATSSAASSSASSASAKSSASASSAGTTLVVNPAAAPTVSTAPAAPTSSGATAVGAAGGGVLGTNGATASVKLSVSAMFLAVGAVAAML